MGVHAVRRAAYAIPSLLFLCGILIARASKPSFWNACVIVVSLFLMVVLTSFFIAVYLHTHPTPTRSRQSGGWRTLRWALFGNIVMCVITLEAIRRCGA